MAVPAPIQLDVIEDITTLQRDGIAAKKGAFSRDWVEQLREDMTTAFWEAIQRPGGAVGRGSEMAGGTVPSTGGVGALRGAGSPQVPAHGRYFVPVCLDDSPGDGSCIADSSSGAGAGRGRARGGACGSSRHDGHTRLLR